MAQAILINVSNQTVTTINIQTVEDIVPIIGNGCISTTAQVMENGDYIVFDMGAFFSEPNNRTPQGGFSLTTTKWLLMDNAVIIGWDMGNGSVEDCTTTVQDVQNAITFYDSNYCVQAQK